MPILRPCRRPYCPNTAGPDGWCPLHWHPRFHGSEPLPEDWPELRAEVLKRDGHRCRFCGRLATTVDHILPRARGGSHALHNLRALCARCHHRQTGRLLGA